MEIGTVIHGFCGGWFGRDSYGCKRLEAQGVDWAVFRADDGLPEFCPRPANELEEYRVSDADHRCKFLGGILGEGLTSSED